MGKLRHREGQAWPEIPAPLVESIPTKYCHGPKQTVPVTHRGEITVVGAGLIQLGGARGNSPWVSWPEWQSAWIWRNLTSTDLTPQVISFAMPSSCSLNSGHSLSAQFACLTVSVCKLLFILQSPSSHAPFFMQPFLIRLSSDLSLWSSPDPFVHSSIIVHPGSFPALF